MPRRAELSVLTRRGDFSKHVLVQVPFGIAIVHRHRVDHVNDFGQQRRGRDREPSVFHVVGIGRIIATERSQERKDMFGHDVEHFFGIEVLEP